MACVGVGAETQVSPVTIKEPDKARINGEGSHGGELGGIVISPVASDAAEGGQSGRGGKAGPTEGEDAAAGTEDLVKGLYIVVRRH